MVRKRLPTRQHDGGLKDESLVSLVCATSVCPVGQGNSPTVKEGPHANSFFDYRAGRTGALLDSRATAPTHNIWAYWISTIATPPGAMLTVTLSAAPGSFLITSGFSDNHSSARRIFPPRKLIVGLTTALRSTVASPCCGLNTPLLLMRVITHPRSLRFRRYSTSPLTSTGAASAKTCASMWAAKGVKRSSSPSRSGTPEKTITPLP